ncbi:MAG: TRAP transporter small permease [Beijerinckiaceae bacterium]|nr:TRAP transporter small permease [Beijerinckiaceae bacterium]
MASQTPSEIHTPISSEEIARTFDEEVAPVDLSGYRIEDWLTLAIFWLMCGCVFLQFFTRYVLNNSFGWTEEIAIYCLVAVVFLGSVMCTRLSRHIHVDLVYNHIPPRAGRVLATFVDIMRIAFSAYLAWLVWKYSSIISDEMMTTIQFPKQPVFMVVFAAFVLMALRGVQVMIGNLRRGYSILERPAAFDGPGDPVKGA